MCTRHTVRMIITTIINIIMCSVVGLSWRLEVVFAEYERNPLEGGIVIAIIYKIRARPGSAFMRLRVCECCVCTKMP